MQDQTLLNLERLFLALGDKTRLKLLGLMAKGDVSVGFLVAELRESQPKVSRHLAYLRSMGVVSTRRVGKSIYYGIAPQAERSVAIILATTLGELGSQKPAKRNRAEVRQDEPEISFVEEISEETPGDFRAIAITRDEMDVFLL